VLADDFSGADGSIPDYDKWNPLLAGTTTYVSLSSNQLRAQRTSSVGWLYAYGSQAWLTDAFDIQIDLASITRVSNRTDAFRLRVQKADGTFAQISYEWNGSVAVWQIRDDGTTNTAKSTSVTSGKLRLTRNALGTVRGYFWDAVTSQWVWDDSAGIFIKTLSGAVQVHLRFFAGSVFPSATTTIAVDNFVVVAGCDNISFSSSSCSSSSSSSSSLSSSSSSKSSSSESSSRSLTRPTRWEFKARNGRWNFVAKHRRLSAARFKALYSRPKFKATRER